jgi:hypothetical protein
MNSNVVEENMTGPMKIVMLAVLLIGLMVSSSLAYEIPQRRIDLKPYLNFMFPNDLLEWEDLGNVVANETGFGLGVKARTQVIKAWGFVINTSYTDLEVTSDRGLSSATMLTVGFYYSKATGLGDIIFDLGYGGIAAGGRGIGLLMPSLEFNRTYSERLRLSVELGWPIPNDWFYDFDFEENYGSFTLSLGGAVVF